MMNLGRNGLFFTFYLLMALSAPSRGADWPAFMGSNGDASTEEPVPNTFSESESPWLWSKETGAGFSGPVVADGKVILFHRVGDAEIVDALDELTGKRMWRHSYPAGYRDDFGFDEGPRATPAIQKDSVITYGAEGVLTCLNLQTGERRWQLDLKTQMGSQKGFFGRASSPVVHRDKVYINTGGDKAGSVMFDIGNGGIIWRTRPEEAGYATPVIRNWNSKPSILAVTREGFRVFDVLDGKPAFEMPFRARMHASVNAAGPITTETGVFLTSSYGVGGLYLSFPTSKNEPQIVWQNDRSLSSHYTTGVYHQGHVYGFHGRQEQRAELRCIRIRDGHVAWSQKGTGAGWIIHQGENAIALLENGELILMRLNPERYDPTDKLQILPSPVRAAPAYSRGRFFAKSPDRLVCVPLTAPIAESF